MSKNNRGLTEAPVGKTWKQGKLDLMVKAADMIGDSVEGVIAMAPAERQAALEAMSPEDRAVTEKAEKKGEEVCIHLS